MGHSDLKPAQRVWRGVKRFPADVLFERSEQASVFVDVAQIGLSLFVFHMGFTETLILNWAMGEVPLIANTIRSLAHPHPHAKPGQWWKRDWTYVTRPRANQPKEIAAAPEPPMELEPDKKIPGWLRALTTSAKVHGKASLPGVLDDWLCARSRVVGAVFDHLIVVAGIFVPVAYSVIMIINRVVVLLPGLLGVWIGFRNHDIRRALRGGVFQRDGDVVRVAKPEKELKGSGQEGVTKPKTPAGPGPKTHDPKTCCRRCCKVPSVQVTGKAQKPKSLPVPAKLPRPRDKGLE